MRVCLAQVDPRPGDEVANVRLIDRAVREAGRAGARLVVFPELATTGYRLGEGWHQVGLCARELASLVSPDPGTMALVGFAERTPDGRLYSAAALLDSDGPRIVQRKLRPVEYPPFDEIRWLSPGEDLETFDLWDWRAGILVCNDGWHSRLPSLLARAGVDVIFLLAASAVVPGFDNPRRWSIIARHTAAFYRVWTVFVNRSGVEGAWSFWGGSRVISPDGRMVVRAGREPALVYVDLDRSRDVRPDARPPNRAWSTSARSARREKAAWP